MFSSSKGPMEIAVWRKSDGNWYISPENLSYEDQGDTRRVATLGGPNDAPVPADYDGDGKANIAVWKPATGEWQILDYHGQKQVTFQWGQVMNRDDTPVPANYRHTKKAQLAVFRVREHCEWWISSVDIKSWTDRNKVENYKYTLGKPGDIPIPADYNDDGFTELGVFNPVSCVWQWRTLKSDKVTKMTWGEKGDIPFPGHYFDKKKTVLAAYRPSKKEWHFKGHNPVKLNWVTVEDRPMPGDYSGDGTLDIAFWRPSNSTWLIHQPGQAEPRVINWGLPGEVPVSADYGMKGAMNEMDGGGHGARHAKYVRLFPDLDGLHVDSATLAELGADGGVMEDKRIGEDGRPHPDGDNDRIPAGYTYFGQFIDHDITFDPTSSLEGTNDPDQIQNFRTPRLELDSVYGMGPSDQPYLYNKEVVINGEERVRPQKLIFGSAGNEAGDLNRNDDGIAIIGDMRNDENLAVAQLQLSFIKFHNAVVDIVKAERRVADSAVFGEAQRIVRWHYQWMVVNDYLVRMCGRANVDRVLNEGRRFYLTDQRTVTDPDMPIEFSVAAYRFGHSQVRPQYNWNSNFPFATMFQLFFFTKNPVPKSWDVQYEQLLDVNGLGDEHVPNKTRKIDTRLAGELLNLGFLPAPTSLAERNLKRGVAYQLPSGQDVAREMGISVVRPSEMPADVREKLTSLGLAEATPLWYYILLESEVRENGERLGDVGAQIVADVMIGLIQLDPDSYLNSMERNASGEIIPWTPHLDSIVPGQFTLADMVNIAGWDRRDNPPSPFEDRRSSNANGNDFVPPPGPIDGTGTRPN